jgi:hypothetical protein
VEGSGIPAHMMAIRHLASTLYLPESSSPTASCINSDIGTQKSAAFYRVQVLGLLPKNLHEPRNSKTDKRMPHGVCEGRVLSAKPCVEHVKKRNRCPQDTRFACTKAEAPHEVGYLSTAEVGWQHSPTFLFGYCTYHGELTYNFLFIISELTTSILESVISNLA